MATAVLNQDNHPQTDCSGHILSRINLLCNAWARRYNSAICCSKMS